ncbi:hypothetical protein GCM10011613_18840 [Cellvibrio zantedeschiae]|uniref:Uncharacterized protein n=1 Tax=Cellvibrio zantedeschiae TaxID=1237077 RepID=A0ABQ3B1P7_9GAMM|nr:hypothetical protein [Cellvibrio zantedeschiae]GGY73796.1 hypothetical protein GCM10011613_18840 [Cellvibrio zantedeschiae]
MESMRNCKNYLCALFLAILCSCAAAEDKPNQIIGYSKNNISFSMPSNWKVTEDVGENSSRHIFVESPGTAMVMVNTYAKENAPSFKEYVVTITDRANKKFWLGLGSISNGKISEFKSSLNGREVTVFKNEYVAKIFGLSVPHVSEFYCFESESYIAYVSSQAATEDLPMVSSGFNLVLSTFSWNQPH